jgi:hypothetical protein
MTIERPQENFSTGCKAVSSDFDRHKGSGGDEAEVQT